MKKITFFAVLFGAFGANVASAQFIVKPSFFETLGISNQGVVAGYEGQAGPYSIWNPETEAFYQIGGAAPGQGIGGATKFSADGIFLSGTNFIEQEISTAWTKRVLADFNYIFTAVEFPENQNGWGYAAGKSLTSNGNGILLRTVDSGVHWTEQWSDTNHNGLDAMSFPTIYTGYVGGTNHYLAKTTDAANEWTMLNPAPNDNVIQYQTINFKDENSGIVTAKLQDGFAVYATFDGGITWETGSGLAGVPVKTCYAGGDTYFLITDNGAIQKSADSGMTWTTVHSVLGTLAGISFYDNASGIVTGERYIYKTTDGAGTWSAQDVAQGIVFKAVKYLDDFNIIIAGSNDAIFGSVDGGITWTRDNQAVSDGETSLHAIAITDQDIHITGAQGNFYKKSLISGRMVAQMSRYNLQTGHWTDLGSFGQTVDATTSAGYCISGDGNTVVGNSWADPSNGNGYTVYAHGFAWNQTEGNIDLGSLYANVNRSSRANAVSNDGSVVVGLQDLNGPWKSAVWRKNPAGGYFPNSYLLVDPHASATDEYNQLGECSTVTADGNWIGGEGSYSNNNEPWIWSERTGVINLGDLTEGLGYGRVAGISPGGSMAIGWFEMLEWGSPTVPFIWTAANGIQNINDYITETLGYPTEANQIWVANNMSLNGKYVTGWGFNETIGEYGELFTFRLELPETLAANEFTNGVSNVYPNPVKAQLNISSAEKINRVEIYNVSGQMLLRDNSKNGITKINVESLANGVYFVKTYAGTRSGTHKIIKN